MKIPHLLSKAQVNNINPDLTMSQLLKIYNVTGVWDYALPQSFVDNMIEITGFNPVGQCVWFYSRAEFWWGVPFPLTLECLEALREYVLNSDNAYIEEYLNKNWKC